MIKMLSLITFSTDPIDHFRGEPQCNLSNRYRYGIDFKNPFTMSNREPRSHYQRRSAELVSSSSGYLLGERLAPACAVSRSKTAPCGALRSAGRAWRSAK